MEKNPYASGFMTGIITDNNGLGMYCVNLRVNVDTEKGNIFIRSGQLHRLNESFKGKPRKIDLVSCPYPETIVKNMQEIGDIDEF